MAYIYLNYHLLVICKKKEMKNLEDIAIERVGKMQQGDTFVHDDVVCCTLSDDKSVAWLKENLSKAMVRSDLYLFNGEFINDFKRYMEE